MLSEDYNRPFYDSSKILVPDSEFFRRFHPLPDSEFKKGLRLHTNLSGSFLWQTMDIYPIYQALIKINDTEFDDITIQLARVCRQYTKNIIDYPDHLIIQSTSFGGLLCLIPLQALDLTIITENHANMHINQESLSIQIISNHLCITSLFYVIKEINKTQMDQMNVVQMQIVGTPPLELPPDDSLVQNATLQKKQKLITGFDTDAHVPDIIDFVNKQDTHIMLTPMVYVSYQDHPPTSSNNTVKPENHPLEAHHHNEDDYANIYIVLPSDCVMENKSSTIDQMSCLIIDEVNIPHKLQHIEADWINFGHLIYRNAWSNKFYCKYDTLCQRHNLDNLSRVYSPLSNDSVRVDSNSQWYRGQIKYTTKVLTLSNTILLLKRLLTKNSTIKQILYLFLSLNSNATRFQNMSSSLF
ncbi:Hypothetical_protein [Hexamita inflata]|uniref:Hypothetical_protein n=1 Tax=Hexamita inflata TaxID=28002 RepID=A0AA86U2M6_9EUKA|nr:Hypothetical protein HINF_LOCUS27450 [Hexamita inflata]